jgi:predicted DNA-binding transcriptional regulator AlpA
MSARILKFRDLKDRQIVGSRMTLHRWLKSGAFPAPIELGPNSRGWLESEVLAWLESRRRVSPSDGRAA